MPTRRSRITRLAKAAVLTTVALALAPAAASAAVCPDIPSSQVFSQFGDTNDYFLAPGGDFEASSAWTRPGVDRVDYAKPWDLAGGKALRLNSGKTTTSPEFCVSERHPHFRFFAIGEPGSTLRVEAIDGRVTTGLSIVPGDGAWHLTEIVPLATALGILGDDGHDVKLRITSVGGDSAIDGVYIDPYRR
jgi:hypothetical protein